MLAHDAIGTPPMMAEDRVPCIQRCFAAPDVMRPS
jgi:hypothetical protein